MAVFLSNYHGLPVQRNKWEKALESKARSDAPCRIRFVLKVMPHICPPWWVLITFWKRSFESCYVVPVALRVVNLYTFLHHRMSLLSWQMFTRETHLYEWFIEKKRHYGLWTHVFEYIEVLPIFCFVTYQYCGDVLILTLIFSSTFFFNVCYSS